MKIAVLGLGKIGLSTAALLKSRGHDVTGYTRSAEKAQKIQQYGITVKGALTGNFKVPALCDMAEAVRGAAVIVVTTLAQGHRPIAEKLKGLLERGQIILIFNGNWGAYEFYSVLRDEARAKQVVIGETGGNISAAPLLEDPITITVKPAKKSMSFASIPAASAPRAVEILREAVPQLYGVGNVLDTTMNSLNPPVHVPMCIFNITRILNGEECAMFKEGMPQRTLDFLMAADEERCAVTKAAGGTSRSILELFNSMWGVQYDNIKDLGLDNPSLGTVRLPKTPEHRFLNEDVPYGFLPLSVLGKKYGVPTPHIDLLVSAWQLLFPEHAVETGPAFDVDFQEIL